MKSKVTIGVRGKNEQDSRASQGLENITMTVTSFEMGTREIGAKEDQDEIVSKSSCCLGIDWGRSAERRDWVGGLFRCPGQWQ